MNPAPQIALILSCLGIGWSGQVEVKYNLAGPFFPMYAEHAMEVAYARNDFLIPFIRFAILDRDYEQEYWDGGVAGRSTEKGYEVWIGEKIRPIAELRGLKLLISYRHAGIDFAHEGFGPSSVIGKDEITADAIGGGLCYAFVFNDVFVIEPFWYGDYGRYDIKKVYGDTKPNSPYEHEWDDEHRVGVNFGLKLGYP